MESASAHNTTNISFASVSSSDTTEVVRTIYSAHRTDGAFRTISLFNDSRTTPNNALYVKNSSSTAFTADLSTARVDTDSRLIFSAIDSSKNMSAFDNGATGGTDTYTGTTLTSGSYIGRLNGGLNQMYGTIQEIIIFSQDESANRTAIETDINGHYSIY